MFGATVIVPLAFNVNPVGMVAPVKLTFEEVTANPFRVSLLKTEVVVPPVKPLIGPAVSFKAFIGVTATAIGNEDILVKPKASVDSIFKSSEPA